MTKEEIIDELREIEFHFRSLSRINKDNHYGFGNVGTNEIHLERKYFYKVVEILQPTTTFNPNWCDRYPWYTEAYFNIELNDHKYKIFALLLKEGLTDGK